MGESVHYEIRISGRRVSAALLGAFPGLYPKPNQVATALSG